MLKQAQFSPLRVSGMALALYAVDRGHLDDIELKNVVSFENALHRFARKSHAELLDRIDNEPKLTEEVANAYDALIAAFKDSGTWAS